MTTVTETPARARGNRRFVTAALVGLAALTIACAGGEVVPDNASESAEIAQLLKQTYDQLPPMVEVDVESATGTTVIHGTGQIFGPYDTPAYDLHFGDAGNGWHVLADETGSYSSTGDAAEYYKTQTQAAPSFRLTDTDFIQLAVKSEDDNSNIVLTASTEVPDFGTTVTTTVVVSKDGRLLAISQQLGDAAPGTDGYIGDILRLREYELGGTSAPARPKVLMPIGPQHLDTNVTPEPVATAAPGDPVDCDNLPGLTDATTAAHLANDPVGGLRMATTAVFHRANAEVTAVTDVRSVLWLRGFTSATLVFLYDQCDQVLFVTMPERVGVDGTWIGQSHRTVAWSRPIPAALAPYVHHVGIEHRHDPASAIEIIRRWYGPVCTVLQYFTVPCPPKI